MSRASLRLIVAILGAVWIAPSAGALSVGLHLALEHRGPSDHHHQGHNGVGSHDHHHDLDHQQEPGQDHSAIHYAELVELLQAATHGHSHDWDVTPDHDHDATFGVAKLKLRPDLSLVAVPHLQIALEPALAEQVAFEGVPRRGPPTPLFTSHCALLL